MTNPDLQARFRDLGDVGVPNVHTLADDRLRCMWVLHVAKEHLDEAWLTAPQISTVLRDTFGINISRQRVYGLVAADKIMVAQKTVDGRHLFQVMKAGSDVVAATRSVVFVEPAAALSRLRVVQDMFGELRDDVRVCDPYVDGATLDMLAHLDRAASIKLLSVNIKDKGGIVRDTKAFIAEHGKPLEIRLGPKGQLHDRYVIHDDGMLLVGTSLNSIGLKQSFVVALGEVLRASVLRSFADAWNKGQPVN